MTKKLVAPAKVLHIHDGLEIVTYVKGRKLAERKLGPIVLKLSYSTQRYDLADQTASNEDEWRLFIGEADEGGFRVRTHQETSNWSIASSRIENTRGVGIGKWVYQALTEYYGILESDPYGTTSEDATRVWKKLGAEVLEQNGNRPRYRLYSKKLKAKMKTKKAKKKVK